jgi:hypothetical protein
MTTTTIDEVYAAINPLPALLSAKGKISPDVKVQIEANASVSLIVTWRKFHAANSWDRDYNVYTGDTFDEVLQEAMAMIDALPSAEQAKLHRFMGQLGRLIDEGRSDGIETDYLNPLLDTMKRLSENVITYQPEVA